MASATGAATAKRPVSDEDSEPSAKRAKPSPESASLLDLIKDEESKIVIVGESPTASFSTALRLLRGSWNNIVVTTLEEAFSTLDETIGEMSRAQKELLTDTTAPDDPLLPSPKDPHMVEEAVRAGASTLLRPAFSGCPDAQRFTKIDATNLVDGPPEFVRGATGCTVCWFQCPWPLKRSQDLISLIKDFLKAAVELGARYGVVGLVDTFATDRVLPNNWLTTRDDGGQYLTSGGVEYRLVCKDNECITEILCHGYRHQGRDGGKNHMEYRPHHASYCFDLSPVETFTGASGVGTTLNTHLQSLAGLLETEAKRTKDALTAERISRIAGELRALEQRVFDRAIEIRETWAAPTRSNR
jgi:hypothetical protein